jgi:hypothetical protein
MNTTTLLYSLSRDFNSTPIINQPWFIPLNIILIICLSLGMILGLAFLCIVLLDKTCHTVSMMLVTNSCLAIVFFKFTLFWMAVISLHNDLKQIQYEDPPCQFRSYLLSSAACEMYYSFLLQAIYRYVTVVYPTKLFWQSAKFQFFLIIVTWICSFAVNSSSILTGEVKYHLDDQACQMPLRLSAVLMYGVVYAYIIPINCTILIYFKLVRYVKQINRRMAQAHTLSRARRELRMVHRIMIIISILNILAIPYLIFLFMGIISQPPKYPFRIAFTSIDISLFTIIIVLFKFTDPVKASIITRMERHQNTMAAAATIN